MHVSMMHVSMILDPDTCMYDAYIYVPRPLTLMHVCVMGGSPGRDGAVVGLEQAYYEVGICLICTFDDTNFIAVNICRQKMCHGLYFDKTYVPNIFV